jgi:hypothetical protein
MSMIPTKVCMYAWKKKFEFPFFHIKHLYNTDDTFNADQYNAFPYTKIKQYFNETIISINYICILKTRKNHFDSNFEIFVLLNRNIWKIFKSKWRNEDKPNRAGSFCKILFQKLTKQPARSRCTCT